MSTYTEHEIAPLQTTHQVTKTDPLPVHPMAVIREAFQRIHRYATGDTRRAYMSIPADPRRDADLILVSALDELERRRVAANDPRKALEVAVERIGDICQLYRIDDDLLKRELGERLEKDLAEMQRVLAETAPPTP